MDLSALLPQQRTPGCPVDIPNMIANGLLAASQHPALKRLLGWRGMSICARGPKGWTVRLAARPGIFGLCSMAPTGDESPGRVDMGLLYFPDPDEPLLETMSLAAMQAALDPDYRERVRVFSQAPEWAAPFLLGRLRVALAPGEDALALVLEAPERKICIARDGVAAPTGQWIVAPGEAEEDFPALDIAKDLGLALAAALTHALGQPPERYLQQHTRGEAPGYTAKGEAFASGLPLDMAQHCLSWGPQGAALAAPWLDAPGIDCGPDQRTLMPEALAQAPLWDCHDLAAMREAGTHEAAFDERPALIVLSGFLGSGKTTFLNQLLEYHAARDELVAIIQNEVGQTGVDGTLLEGDDSIVELDEGCVCCTLAGSISRGVRQLKSRFNPGVIVLESTGLANPFNILHELQTLNPVARLESITTLVDAANIMDQIGQSDIARRQIEAADVILLNKCDLVSPEDKDRILATLRGLNKRALMTETMHGAVNPGLLYDVDAKPRTVPGLLPAAHGAEHDHAMEGFTSRRLGFGRVMDREALARALDELPAGVFRLKGIVGLDDGNGRDRASVVQYVCGRYEFSPLGQDFDDEYFLTAIGRDMNLHALERLQENPR